MTITPDEIAIAWSEYLSIRDRSGAPISPAARQRRQAELNAAQAKAEALTRRWKIQTRGAERTCSERPCAWRLPDLMGREGIQLR